MSKKIYFSFVLGRLSNKIGDFLQYFPIDNWEKNLQLSKNYNFNGVEWIISDFSNPLFNDEFFKKIKKKLRYNKIKLSSIYMDLIMDNPLHKISEMKLSWLINKLKKLQKKILIPRISIPIEERSRFKTKSERRKVIINLKKILSSLSIKSKICIETDISVKKLDILLKTKGLNKLGILIDIGNIRANNFNISKYFDLFPNKIYGVHIKYRPKNNGKSKILKKNFKELKYLKSNLAKLKNLNDITFQTFRSNNKYLRDMKKNLINYYDTKKI